MTHRRHPTIFRCVRLGALALVLIAPDARLAAAPLRMLAWDDAVAARKLELVDSRGQVTITDLHPAKRTRIYHVTAADKPVVIRALDRTDDAGKPAASTVVVPRECKQPLLLLLPDEKAATGLRLFALDDDDTNFPWGATRFINATGRKLGFVMEKRAVVLPASWTPVPVNPGGTDRNIEVKLYFFDEPKVPIYSAIWEQRRDMRSLVFLVPGQDPRLGPVALKMIPEIRSVAAAETGP